MRNRFARVLRISGQTKGLGAVKGGRKSDFACLVRVDLYSLRITGRQNDDSHNLSCSTCED